MPLSPVCQSIENDIKNLQQDLQQADSSEKPAIAAQIKKRQKDLQQCIKDHPYIPPPTKSPPLRVSAFNPQGVGTLDPMIAVGHETLLASDSGNLVFYQ